MEATEEFEQNRDHLRAVAQRMLGSPSEADDAVQEAWLRLSRSDTAEVENMRAWLTTVVSRICLDMLRARRTRREDLVDEWSGQPVVALFEDRAGDPEHEALLADSVGVALMVVLDTLAPAERLAFVLHDMFGVPFDEIGPIIDRNAGAARQLASRARRRVRRRDHRARAWRAVRASGPAGCGQRQAERDGGSPRAPGVAGRVHDRRRPRHRDGPAGRPGQAPERAGARRLSAARTQPGSSSHGKWPAAGITFRNARGERSAVARAAWPH